jgi:hypothetical protein
VGEGASRSLRPTSSRLRWLPSPANGHASGKRGRGRTTVTTRRRPEDEPGRLIDEDPESPWTCGPVDGRQVGYDVDGDGEDGEDAATGSTTTATASTG